MKCLEECVILYAVLKVHTSKEESDESGSFFYFMKKNGPKGDGEMKRKRTGAVLICTCLFAAGALGGCQKKGETGVETETVYTEVLTEIQTETQAETQMNISTETESVFVETEDVTTEAKETENIEEAQMYESYAEIVGRYQEAFAEAKSDGVPEEIPEDMSYEFYAAVSYQEQDYAGFQLYDLNSDGTPELFIGMYSGSEASDLFIYDVYTWKDGRRIRLMDDIGYRGGTCIICEGGIIKDLSSGSAYDSMQDYHRLPEHGEALEIVESISAHGDMESGELFYYHDSEGNPENRISEEEYNDISDSYKEIKGILSYQATTENLEKLRAGECLL